MRRPTPLAPPAAPALQAEFVWEGKYDARGRRRRPDPISPPPCPQPEERWGAGEDAPQAGPGGPAAAEAPALPLPEAMLPAAGNLLLGGDNLLAMAALLPHYRGQVQLIYIDPPFDTGVDHTMRVPVGAGNGHRERTGRGKARGGHVRLVAYRDAWGVGEQSYLQMMYERLCAMRELLRDTGVLALHCDWRSHAALRLMLDEVFGAERFLNEIVWHYYNKYSAASHCVPRAHDTILLYARGARPALNPLREPREQPSRQLVRENVDGVLRNARDDAGRLRYRVVHDRKLDDVWRIPQLQPASAQWSGYSTQKHHDLLERIVALASREGDLVADFFCGAGTTLAVAERMGRRWIGCDLGAMALHTTRKRLLRARRAAPEAGAAGATALPAFETASLAGVARQRWIARAFGGRNAACRREVLAAFGAQPAPTARGSARIGLHGWLDDTPCAFPDPRGEAPCGAPGTLAAVRGALRAAATAGASRLYLLAWRFDARFRELLGPELAESGVDLVPVQVPDALVSPAGSAPAVFRALPRLDVRVERAAAAQTLVLRLAGFQPGPARPAWGAGWEPAPEPGADPLTWLDGWSVDATWQAGRPFAHQWWDFRTPHRRALADRSAALPGGGQPCVLTTDVWGSATLHAVPVAPRRGPRR